MKKIIGALICGALFAAEIALLKTYDVAAIGPSGTEIGFSHINQRVHELTGVNMVWYKVTDLIGYGAIGICLIFAFIGLVQLIRRKSLFKVDKEILALGGLFAVTIGCYVLFEKVIINYRPIIMPGETAPEASFPSSHTVLIIVVLIAVMMIIDNYASDLLTGLIRALCVIVAAAAVAGRLYCGVHWLTDIIGGILLSAALLFIFAGIITAGDEAAVSAGGADFSVSIDKKAAAPKAADKKAGGESTAGYKPKH